MGRSREEKKEKEGGGRKRRMKRRRRRRRRRVLCPLPEARQGGRSFVICSVDFAVLLAICDGADLNWVLVLSLTRTRKVFLDSGVKVHEIPAISYL